MPLEGRIMARDYRSPILSASEARVKSLEAHTLIHGQGWNYIQAHITLSIAYGGTDTRIYYEFLDKEMVVEMRELGYKITELQQYFVIS